MWKIILFILFPLVGSSQDPCKYLPVKKVFYKSDRLNVFDSLFMSRGYLDISLYSDFDDSCILMIDDEVQFNERIQTNRSIGHTNKRIILSSERYPCPVKLTIRLVGRHLCLTEILDLTREYWTLGIWLHKDKWIFDYSNHIPFGE